MGNVTRFPGDKRREIIDQKAIEEQMLRDLARIKDQDIKATIAQLIHAIAEEPADTPPSA